METLQFWINLFVGLLLAGLYARPSLAFPPKQYLQHASLHRPQKVSGREPLQAPAERREQVNTVGVTCHPESLEVVVKADMFGLGAPVNVDELRLGVEYSDHCRAAASSADEYRIVVGLMDCGTKHWMTENSLVYTNLLIYAPEASPEGVIRMDEAVIPIECHYERKYSLSSSSLMPTWIPFLSTQAAVETLEFDLRLMTDDFLYERGANVYYLGDPISIEASVRIGHHMGLRVFLSSCVATLSPDIHSVPRYVFIENGCLVDSQLPGSRSHFLSRMEDDKLQLVIDAFRFHNEDRGELYITCHLSAVPVNDAEVPQKACTLVNGRWRSADGNDYLCGLCQSQNEAGQTLNKPNKPSSPAKFSPRGFGTPAKSQSFGRSNLNSKAWEQEARVGPVLVLPPMPRSGPLPVEELPPVLNKISRTALYGSQWRSGINRIDLEKELLPDQSVPDVEDTGADFKGEDDVAEPLEREAPVVPLKSNVADLHKNGTSSLSSIISAPSTVDVTAPSNTTAPESDLSQTNAPKR